MLSFSSSETIQGGESPDELSTELKRSQEEYDALEARNDGGGAAS